MKKIGAVVGASPLNPGWAVTAHHTALRALPQYELRAVGTNRRDSADAAREALPLHTTTITTLSTTSTTLEWIWSLLPRRSTQHYDIVSAALDAGKMVFSEWPLDIDSAQAIALETKAKRVPARERLKVVLAHRVHFGWLRSNIRNFEPMRKQGEREKGIDGRHRQGG